MLTVLILFLIYAIARSGMMEDLLSKFQGF